MSLKKKKKIHYWVQSVEMEAVCFKWEDEHRFLKQFKKYPECWDFVFYFTAVWAHASYDDSVFSDERPFTSKTIQNVS